MAPSDADGLIWAPWRLSVQLRRPVRRNILGRYRSSMAGLAWSLLQPLPALAMRKAVLGVLLGMR